MEIKPEFFHGNQYAFLDQFESVKSDPLAVAGLFERNPYFEINVVDAVNTIPGLVGEGIEKISLNFLGIFNLGVKPTYDLNLITKIRLVYSSLGYGAACGSDYIFINEIIYETNEQNPNSQVNQTNKTMMYFGPIMTLFIGFQAPLGLSLYWTVSNLFQMAQQFFLDKHIYKKKEE